MLKCFAILLIEIVMDGDSHSASAPPGGEERVETQSGGEQRDDTDLGITRSKPQLYQLGQDGQGPEGQGQEGQGHNQEGHGEQASNDKDQAMNGLENTVNMEELDDKSRADVNAEQETMEESVASSLNAEQLSSSVSEDLSSAKPDNEAPEMTSSVSTDSDIIRHEVAHKLVDNAIQEASEEIVKEDLVPGREDKVPEPTMEQGTSSLGEGLRHRTTAAAPSQKQVHSSSNVSQLFENILF